jgi:hypothetical protein
VTEPIPKAGELYCYRAKPGPGFIRVEGVSQSPGRSSVWYTFNLRNDPSLTPDDFVLTVEEFLAEFTLANRDPRSASQSAG